ncbi:MAG: DUF2283 domain-containing protein [Anaerolineae bacterium]
MASSVRIEVTYSKANDTLYLRTLPKRPARMEETDCDFYIRYDWDDPSKIVGFEWLDFSVYFNALDEPGVIPELDMRFDVVGVNLTNATLREVLQWAYRTFVLEEEMLPATPA